MIKQILLICVVLLFVNAVSAGEIVKDLDTGTIYIYDEHEDTVRFMGELVLSDYPAQSYNKSVCINSTCIEGEITISNDGPYELEYTFIADINDSAYVSRIVIMKQEVLSSSFLAGRVLERTLTIDGIEIATYQTKWSFFGNMKKDTFYWCLFDNQIRYGDDIYFNTSIAFTQLNYQDQQDMIPEGTYSAKKEAKHFYRTVGVDREEGLKLSGLTGWIYNAIGLAPWDIGTSLQGLMFTPLAITQYTFNFIFSFLFLIINNWWYAVLLLEIFCIIPALTHTEYPEMVATYISMHVKIFKFMYKDVFLPTHKFILRIIEIVRNMFKLI